MEKTRLPAGGRTAANIHPRQAEKDLERNSRSDGHSCAGGKHALSMPEEPFPSARIISIARIRGTTVKAARAELPNGRNRSGTGPSSDNLIGRPGSISETGLSNSATRTRPSPIVTFTSFRIGHEPYTLGSGGMATVAGGHSIGATMRWGASSVVETALSP